MEYEGEAESHP